MPKNIVVIVKNKLISIDTVIPILIELKEKYRISSIVVVSDEMAHKGINKNIVLRDAVNYVGYELYIENKSPYKAVKKLYKVRWFFILFFKLIMGTKVLHFGVFDTFPFSIFGKIFGKNLYFLQSDSFKHSYYKFDELLGKNSSIVTTPISKNIVAFNDGMRHLDVLNNDQKVFMFGVTRTRRSWINYIKQRSDDYFFRYHSNVDLSKGCVVLILATFEAVPTMRIPSNSIKTLFKDTIGVLDNLRGNLPVLLKPHVFTDLKIVNKAIHDLDDFHLTYLHPTVLAIKARVFICNIYSTVMADAHSLKVKTVEYSDYNIDVLRMSKGKSTGYEHVDEFINNDKVKFKKIIESILSNEIHTDNQFIGENIEADADELFTRLAE